MSARAEFDQDLILGEPDRGTRLISEFYAQYHGTGCHGARRGQHEETKAAFYLKCLEARHQNERSIGLDVGCRGGVLIKLVGLIKWCGIDIDSGAVQAARDAGIPCAEMDFTAQIGMKDGKFDAVMMTEVLEHLPYPPISVQEVHRILKKAQSSVFLGSVPLDYHLHRRWKVVRGKRLSGEQTHVHHFSFNELDHLLRFYFEKVDYLVLSGTAKRYPRLNLSYNLFDCDIAWAASSPRLHPGRWETRRHLY